MRYHYTWLLWSAALLVPWLALYAAKPGGRRVMWRTSFATALFGLTQPIFVPEYWNPPSLFELAQRTGFDVESLIFSFAIGGIGAVLYNALAGRSLVPLGAPERAHRVHRFHRAALLGPFILFLPLYLLPWNPIYPSIVCLVAGALASALCRPDLRHNILLGGGLFLGLYALFMLGLRWATPGYMEQVWNLPVLSGVLLYGIPLEELLFGLSFGMYWAGAYEHFTWHTSVPSPPAHASAAHQHAT